MDLIMVYSTFLALSETGVCTLILQMNQSVHSFFSLSRIYFSCVILQLQPRH